MYSVSIPGDDSALGIVSYVCFFLLISVRRGPSRGLPGGGRRRRGRGRDVRAPQSGAAAGGAPCAACPSPRSRSHALRPRKPRVAGAQPRHGHRATRAQTRQRRHLRVTSSKCQKISLTNPPPLSEYFNWSVSVMCRDLLGCLKFSTYLSTPGNFYCSQ